MSAVVTRVFNPTLAPAYFLARGGETYGPHPVEEIRNFIESGTVSIDDLLWTDGMPEWQAIGETLGLAEPVAKIAPPRFEEMSEAIETEPIWKLSRPDGVKRRLSVGLTTAVFLHLCLLVSVTLGAPLFFKLNTTAAPAAPPPETPLDVTFVEEPDTPPPPPDTPPPPPPDDPPPPPALADMPIPTDMPPPTPTPVSVPEPLATPPALPAPIAPVRAPQPKAVKVARIKVAEPIPASDTPVDAGPSDYLRAPAPNYPFAARQEHESGTVILLVMVSDAGLPERVTVAESSGYPILDNAAQRQVAREFRFRVGNSRALHVPISFRTK